MAVSAPRRSAFAPWAGLAAGMLAVLLQHQGVGDALHFGCGFDARLANVVAGGIAFVLIAAGAWVSSRTLAEPGVAAPTRRFIAIASLMAAALFALMVAWQTMAGLIVVPPCLP
jgi:hypothetical protein